MNDLFTLILVTAFFAWLITDSLDISLEDLLPKRPKKPEEPEYPEPRPQKQRERSAFDDELEFIKQTDARHKYMKTKKWEDIRQFILKINNSQCDVCGISGPLDIHHISYAEPAGQESIFDLVPLCRECHIRTHKHHGFPDRHNYKTKRFTPI
jgi:5-methylcytosine-specific restriction endonuclease McrA